MENISCLHSMYPCIPPDQPKRITYTCRRCSQTTHQYTDSYPYSNRDAHTFEHTRTHPYMGSLYYTNRLQARSKLFRHRI
jgi:hypothetical protein